MADKLTPDLIRYGWTSEARSHRDNLERALDAVGRQLADARRALNEKGEAELHALRQMAIDATEAVQHGAGLAAMRRLEFALPDATDAGIARAKGE